MDISEYLVEPYHELYSTLSEDNYFQGVVNAVVNEAEPHGVIKEALNMYFSMLSDVEDIERVDFVEYAEMVILSLPDLQRVLRKRSV